jgi:hypothetical protein
MPLERKSLVGLPRLNCKHGEGTAHQLFHPAQRASLSNLNCIAGGLVTGHDLPGNLRQSRRESAGGRLESKQPRLEQKDCC